jgi:periplasmic protein TonB
MFCLFTCTCLWIFLQSLSHYKSIAMEKQNILTADVLDILFDGRNKDYGAYDLRKTYNRRMYKALTSVFLFAGLCYGGYVLANVNKSKARAFEVSGICKLEPIPPPQEEQPKPIEPVKPKKIDIETVKITPPKIVDDIEVKPEDALPENENVIDQKIGLVNKQGEDGDIVRPVSDGEKNGVVAVPQKQDEEPEIFMKVEIEAQYPGGFAAWARYLTKNLEKNLPQEAIDNGISGTVEVLFVVDEFGLVSNVEAVSGPAELREAAVAVIKKSGKWEPGIQNSKKVKSYKRQPITIKLEEQ